MALKTSRKTNLVEGLQQLLELNFDAIEAYEVAIKKFSHSKYREQLLEFKADRERHIRNISSFIRHNLSSGKSNLFSSNRNKEFTKKGDWIKTFLSSLFNKHSNDDDLVADWESAEILIALNMQDEVRHAIWFKTHGEELLDDCNIGLNNYNVN